MSNQHYDLRIAREINREGSWYNRVYLSQSLRKRLSSPNCRLPEDLKKSLLVFCDSEDAELHLSNPDFHMFGSEIPILT